MNPIFEYLFAPYQSYTSLQIILEAVAVVFGIASAIFSKNNNIWVYPLGIISTSIFVYLLWQWGLVGDMLINLYYFVMSIYGWFLWSQKKEGQVQLKISLINAQDIKKSILLFFVTIGFVVVLYFIFNKWNDWSAYVDALTTGLFFVGMWLLAKRKLEHWLLLLAGNIISVPLYFYKGFTVSSILYIIFVIISILGYHTWKKYLHKTSQVVLK